MNSSNALNNFAITLEWKAEAGSVVCFFRILPASQFTEDVGFQREVLMKWSLPLVGLSRIAARCASPLFAVTVVLPAAVLPFMAGCSALPVMKSAATSVASDDVTKNDVYSDAERQRLAELPTIPDFDVVPAATTAADAAVAKVAAEEPEVAAAAAGSAAVAEIAGAGGKSDPVSPPVDSKPAAAESLNEAANDVAAARVAANNPTPEKASNKQSSTSQDVAKLPTTKAEPTKTSPAATTEKSTAADAAPAIPGSGKVATVVPQHEPVQVPMLRIDAPKPFGWGPVGKTTGNRSFQTISVGDEGYRTLVVGSVAGNDPLAIELVEQMARRLHDGKTILGGFQTTIIRTLNPDGEALQKVFNEKGQYINHGFPKDNGAADANQPAEVSFLLEQIRTLKPQRVIHIRSVEGNKGAIATTVASQAAASDAAEWLGFRVIKLPDAAVSGSLERHLSSSGSCEVLTFALPSTSKKKELWERYGDALENLLLGDDAAAREMARQPKQQSSANRSNADGK